MTLIKWVYVAIDATTKLIPSYLVGKRTATNTNAFVADVSSRLRNRVQISTDGLKMYIDAIATTFGAHGVDYAQIVKQYEADPIGEGRYSPPRVSSTEKTPVFGEPISEYVSTSYVERQNLTMRMGMRRFTRPLTPHQRLQQEAGEPLRRGRAPRRALQLRSPSHDAARDARDGRWCRGAHVEHGRACRRRDGVCSVSAKRKAKHAGGRPLLGDVPKAVMFCIRLAPEERAAIDDAAHDEGETASEWARRVLLDAAANR